MELSDRLTAVAGLVTRGNRVCDAGCDHGYVPIYLIQNKISPHVIAMDVRSGPLSRAREHIRRYGMEEYIETRLSDGVEALEQGEADTLILAGMGGRLMEGILKRGMQKVSAMKELILQPQSEIMGFRRFLREQGFDIIGEDMVLEEGKFYPMMRVLPGKADSEKREEYKELADKFGGILLEKKHPVLKEYLVLRRRKQEAILKVLAASAQETEKGMCRIREIEEELRDIEAALQLIK